MKTLKKLLSLLLCMVLVLSFFSAAYAEGEGGIAPVEEADAPSGPEERKDPRLDRRGSPCMTPRTSMLRMRT